jgi:hypothetical protein
MSSIYFWALGLFIAISFGAAGAALNNLRQQQLELARELGRIEARCMGR